MEHRRKFLKKLASTGLTTAAIPAFWQASPVWAEPRNHPSQSKGYTVLFQGDSITDGNRSRNMDWNHVMGHGYAYLIASRLWFDYPDKQFHFYNRGVSGNTVQDLAARWQQDTLALKPDLLSILVGINDVDQFIAGNQSQTVQHYDLTYRTVLETTKKQLPGIQVVLCEPFILPVGRVKKEWKTFEDEIQKRQEVLKKIASDFQAIYLPLQSAFDEALTRAPADYWIWDGIHPMPAGHELIASKWIKKVNDTLHLF